MPWTAVGGTEQATLRIARAVEGEQFKNIMFCREDSPVVSDFFRANGFEIVNFAPAEFSYQYPRPLFRTTVQLFQKFTQRKIDLVHCSDVTAGQYTVIAGRLRGLPVIGHVRNRYQEFDHHKPPWLRALSKFVFVSRNTWEQFGYRVPASRGIVIYDGIDPSSNPSNNGAGNAVQREVRREFGIPDAAKIVGMVARVDPQKDYATLAKGAARIVAVHPDVRFLIVGGYSQAPEHREHYQKVQEMLHASMVAPYFIFTDYRQDVPRLIGAMDVFALSTNFEGLPLVILEAMAQSKPVVATAVDGIPEIVRDNETGLLYPHKDDALLAAHILALLKDERRAATLGAAACQFVKTNFSTARFAANMLNLYRDTLGIT